jgi:guanylate kinase
MIERLTIRPPSFPFVVSGPSGVGKTSVVDRLLEIDPVCERSVSATTRPPRVGEEDGRDYFFVSKERFLHMRDAGELAECALYNGHWYGTPAHRLDQRIAAGRIVVLNIEIQGGFQVRARYPNAVLAFVITPTWDDIRRRLESRGTDTAEQIEQRIRRGMEELQEAPKYDFVIVNDRVERCADDLAAIVRAEMLRVARRPGGGE